MNAHDDFMSVYINMSLHEWHRLVQDIVTSTNEINVKNGVISHYTVDTFIVVSSGLRGECNYDSCLRLGIYCAFNLREGKYVFIVCEELKRCWEVAIINDI